MQTFSKSFVLFDYFANTAAYAKNCINKQKPKMNCNGKCQMMKKLKDEEKKDTQNPVRKGDFKEEVLSSRSFFTLVHSTSIVSINIGQDPFIADPINMPRSIFHPPGA